MKSRYLLCVVLLLSILLCACTEGEYISPPTEKPSIESSGAVSSSVPQASETAEKSDTESQEPQKIVLPSSNDLQFTNEKNGIYNYCPVAMQLSDGTVYIYYCTNKESYKVIDYVGCRKGVRGEDGSIVWGEEKIVFSPSESGWDSHHVCDPSVIAGDFEYGGEHYGYLLAYLGCTSYDNQENKIGIAVANTPEGPFVRVGTKPLIDFVKDPSVSVFQWGVGQPSLVSLDKKGRVQLFYTRGDKDGTRLMMDEWELSDLDAPLKVSTTTVSRSGLRDLNDALDFMNNADIVYDAESNRYYSTSDCHPNPESTPNFISSHFRINYFEKKASMMMVSWLPLITVTPKITGFSRNHNTGFLRDQYGHTTQNGYLTVFYTMSVTGNDSLWSYRIYDYNLKLAP